MIGLMLALQVATPPLHSEPLEASAAPICEVVAVSTKSKPGVSHLYGLCGKVGVLLGSADTYRSAYNAVLKSVVVVSTLNGGRRVVMLSQAASGSPFVNDVTRELTTLSGRYAEAGLTEEVDLTTFAADGAVSVLSRPVPQDLPQGLEMIAASKAGGGAAVPAVPARLDLAPYVAALTATVTGDAAPAGAAVAGQTGATADER